MTYPLILKCDVGGLPAGWISWQEAAGFYARERVRWEMGEKKIHLVGGINRQGNRTVLEVGSIIAVADRARRFGHTPRLTNRSLFERDQNICMYCGQYFGSKYLTRDHIHPKSRGGPNTWVNCVTACQDCNSKKSDKTLEEAGMRLLAVPYAPSFAEYLILSNRKILADQMEFLKTFAKNKAILERKVQQH